MWSATLWSVTLPSLFLTPIALVSSSFIVVPPVFDMWLYSTPLGGLEPGQRAPATARSGSGCKGWPSEKTESIEPGESKRSVRVAKFDWKKMGVEAHSGKKTVQN